MWLAMGGLLWFNLEIFGNLVRVVATIEKLSVQVDEGVLGQDSVYATTYTPSLLHSMPRATTRETAGLNPQLDLRGEDLWTGYEFSWLDAHGKPHISGLRLRVSCQSQTIVESKSFKLYLNSFALTKFETQAEVLKTLDQDLTLAFRSPVLLELLALSQLAETVTQMPGTCLDELDIATHVYTRSADLLTSDELDANVHESLFTHLFRSLCPVTGQPDFASVAIEYRGVPINRKSLLKYLVSYRNHQAFHETTIEQIFVDICQRCQVKELSVYGRFQRRGGLDINPFRSNIEDAAPVYRLARQ